MSALLTRVLENALSAGLIVMTGLNQVIPGEGNMVWVRLGAQQVVAEDLVNYMTGQGSVILSMDYYELFDRIFFASGFVYGLSRLGATSNAIRALEQVSPFPQNINGALVDGSMILMNRTVSDLMETSSTILSTPLRYLVHPSYLVRMG